ncbi:MAG: FtsX-like permease family protein [Planctomycetes bacterium]|nr:FtsX-like permease family protein [Planctomycetota bacterium]
MNDATIIRRSLSARKLSTVFTSLSVAVAVALMLVLLMMRESGRAAFERGSGNMHMLLSGDSDPLTGILNSVYLAAPPRRALEHAKVEELAAKPFWAFFIPTQIGDSYRGLPVFATTGDFFSRFQPGENEQWSFKAGRAFEKNFEVVLGSRAAQETGLKIGDKIALTHGMPQPRSGGNEDKGDQPAPHVHDEYKFEVVGILEPTGGAHDRAIITSITSAWILHAHDRREKAEHDHDHADHDHDHEHAQETMTTEADLTDADKKVTGIYARVVSRPGSNASALIPVVFEQMRSDKSITVAQPAQEINKLFAIVGSVDQILIAMAAVVAASSGISILLALYNSMEQRRRQIAVLRVLGASAGRIFRLVLAESLVLGAIGAAAGVAIAWIGLRIVASEMKARLGLVIEPAISWQLALGVVSGALLLAGVAGLLPAIVAYRTSVAKNLRPLG